MENKIIEPINEPTENKINDLDKPLVEKELNKKVRSLRNAVIACYYIACAIFFGVMGYFSVSLIISLFVPEASVLFSGPLNNFSLGIVGLFGIMLYIFIFGIALLPIALAFFFRNGKANYVSILKGANKENMEIVFARLEFVALLIKEIVIDVILFFAVIVCFLNKMLIIAILLAVALLLAIVFLILVIVDLIRNRVAYNKLSDEEQEEIKEKIKTFRKKKVKKEKRKKAGKLY